jgi:hypothetical protein
VFHLLYTEVWENKLDVKNFHDSYQEFLEFLFTDELLVNDSDDSFKNLIVHVKIKQLHIIIRLDSVLYPN